MSENPDLLAWMGEDELGSGKVGTKAAAGFIPIVAVLDDKFKVGREEVVEQMQQQADQYGKTIRLVRYVPAEELIVVRPRGCG